jgi:translation initiation factor 6 (eIF-6)
MPSDRRYALEPGFRCDALDDVLKEDEEDLVDTLDIMTFSRHLVTNKKVGTIGMLTNCGRRWVKVSKNSQVGFLGLFTCIWV